LRNLREIKYQADFDVKVSVIWNWFRIRKSRMNEWVGHVVSKGGNINIQRVLDFET
jgi:hypothetical protein